MDVAYCNDIYLLHSIKIHYNRKFQFFFFCGNSLLFPHSVLKLIVAKIARADVLLEKFYCISKKQSKKKHKKQEKFLWKINIKGI